MGLYGTDFAALRDPLATDEVSRPSTRARRAYHGPWVQRFDFARAMLGTEEIVPGPPVTIVYERPRSYPGRDDLLANRVTLIGDGASFEDPDHPDEIAYEWCIAEVEFETFTWEANEDEFISIDLEGVSEYQTIGGGLTFSSGQVVPGLFTKLIPQVDFVIDFSKLAGLPLHWFPLVGRVNDAAWRTIPAGHLLFLPASARAQQNISGGVRYQGRAAMSWRAVPWNYAWNPYTGAYEELTPNPYEAGDFSLIASP